MEVRYRSDDDRYTKEQFVRAAYELNTMCHHFKHGAYQPGNRNNMAVDLACLCHVVEIDPIELVGKYLKENEIEDLKDRLNTINLYLDEWDLHSEGVFYYMLGYWKKRKEGDIEIVDFDA